MGEPTTPRSPEDVTFQNVVFVRAVIPVLRHIIEATPALSRAFAGRTGVVQISALLPDGEAEHGRPARRATHLLVDQGEITVRLGGHPAPNLELEFGSEAALNTFFTGGLALPRMRGAAANPGLLAATVRSLLAMSKLLGATEPPVDPARAELLTKCLFYLLTTGISQLNKAGHPAVRRWSEKQPDRAYALVVKGRPELGAYLRVKAGRSKAFRGEYTRSRPFFAMAFADPRAALGILLDVDDMIESTTTGAIEMQGAPEYGAELGDLMQLVGGYAK